MTEDELRRIYGAFARSDASLRDYRIGTVLTVMFGGFLRVSEVVALTRGDVQFDDRQVVVTIRKSKTDQLGNAERRPISRTTDAWCAVRNLEDWLKRLPRSKFLFPNLSSPRSIAESAMSKNTVRAELGRVLRECDINRRLTPHSFRGGAATLAIQRGVPVHAVMSMGRWNSLGGFAPYVDVSTRTLAGADKLM